MNNIFSNFTSPTTSQFTPNNFQGNSPNINQLQSAVPNKPYELKNPDGSIKGYFWYYGNSVDLIFNLSGQVVFEETDNYINVSQLIKDLTVIGTIYNFRHSKIMEFSNLPGAHRSLSISLNKNSINEVEGNSIIIKIDHDTSLELQKGNYYIDLNVIHPSGYSATLFDSNSCVFEVR